MICFEIAFYFRHIKRTDMLHEYINVAPFESTIWLLIVLLFAFPLAVSVRLPVMFLHSFLNFMHPTVYIQIIFKIFCEFSTTVVSCIFVLRKCFIFTCPTVCATYFNASVFGLQTAETFDVNICTDNIHAKNNPNYASVCCTVVFVLVCLFFLLYLLLSEHLKNTCNLFILIKSPGLIICMHRINLETSQSPQKCIKVLWHQFAVKHI